MDNHFFHGFADEMQKLAFEDEKEVFKNLATAGGGVAGLVPGALGGLLAGGKGRRARGAGIGALTGAALLAALMRHKAGGKTFDFALSKEGSEKKLFETNVPARVGARSAAELGAFGALLGLLAGGKGKRLKRALFTGGSLGAIGGLSGLGLSSAVANKVVDAFREPRTRKL